MKYFKIIDDQLLDDVDDGFNYFLDHRLEELKLDDKHYTKSFMDYISDTHLFLRKSLKIDQKLKCHFKIVLIDFIWQF